ncbi:hypothetical protein Tco_0168200 [Tanacetum coccineum]
MAGRLNMLYRDRRVHARTARLMKAEARISREAWGDVRGKPQETGAVHRGTETELLKRLQTQMTEFERQRGPAKGPTQPDAPEEAGSSS